MSRRSAPTSETFIRACLNRSERIVDICDRFGISEKTGHKWLHRFKRGGAERLGDFATGLLSLEEIPDGSKPK
jgi:transposase